MTGQYEQYEGLNIWELMAQARKRIDDVEKELGEGTASVVRNALNELEDILERAQDELCEMVRSQ